MIKKSFYMQLKNIVIMIIFVAMATLIGNVFKLSGFPETNIILMYMLCVVAVAYVTKGYIWGIIASFTSTATFNYFFTAPFYSLSVDDASYLITFVVMIITSLMTSGLTSKVQKNAFMAKQKEKEAIALYSLTNKLSDSKSIHDISRIAVEAISKLFVCNAACICFDEKGFLENTFLQMTDKGDIIHRKIENPSELSHKIEGLRTGYFKDDEYYEFPVYGMETTLAIIRIPNKSAENFTSEQIRQINSMIENIAIAMDRLLSVEKHIRSHEEAVKERYRSNLLRAISHDLRTPLAGISGTSEMLMDMTINDKDKYNLARDINNDAHWLHSLVENILSLTRLQDGNLVIKKELEVVEEVVGSAVNLIEKRLGMREFVLNMPQDILMIPMDAKLIEQVLINLIDNAIRHTLDNGKIEISVLSDNHVCKISVVDNGEGIKSEDLPKIFEMFYTTKALHSDARKGIGLGLTICDAIIKAHGGKIQAKNNENAIGANFTVTLPMED